MVQVVHIALQKNTNTPVKMINVNIVDLLHMVVDAHTALQKNIAMDQVLNVDGVGLHLQAAAVHIALQRNTKNKIAMSKTEV